MISPRRLAVGLVGIAVLIAGTACQDGTPQTPGGTVNPASAKMPDLPKDPNAAEAVVRKVLMDEAIELLKASGLKYKAAQFDVPTSYDDDHAQNGDLLIQFRPCSDADVQAMTAAISAHGWVPAGISHGVSVFKGPLFLQWGNSAEGCDFEMTTVNIDRYLPGIEDITAVPELVAFKAGS